MTESPFPGRASMESFADASELPITGRLAGIDFGTVRVGIAMCDESQKWVTPLETYLRKNEKQDAIFFRNVATRERLVGFVLGLPIHCDGQESEKSQQVRSFAHWLGKVCELPIAFFDERFTTAEARRLLAGTGLTLQQRKSRLDRLAAHLILSEFLESRRSRAYVAEPLEDSSEAEK